MNRATFIRSALLFPLATKVMNPKELNTLIPGEYQGEKMPVLFVGHGSPMNAIEDNEFSRSWRNLGKTIPKPKAVLCVSAHWETNGTHITAMQNPPTIHDFGGFPKKTF